MEPGTRANSQSSVDSWVARRGRAPLLCLACTVWSRRGAEVLRPALELGWGPGLGSCLAVAVGWGRGGGLGDLGPGEGLASRMFTENSPCAGAVLGKGCQGTRQSTLHPRRAHCLGDSVREVDTEHVHGDGGLRHSGCSGGLGGGWPGSCSHCRRSDGGPGEGGCAGGPVGSVWFTR